jgi:hypothetical protein
MERELMSLITILGVVFVVVDLLQQGVGGDKEPVTKVKPMVNGPVFWMIEGAPGQVV